MNSPDDSAGAPGTLVHRLSSILEPLTFAPIFGNTHPVELEIGSGDGSFIVQWAGAHPSRNFLGVERLLGRLRKIDRKARRASLENLRLLRLEAGYMMEYLLPASSLAALHIYFPDPWPKRRHWRRRLINARFVAQAARVLQPGAVIYLRTDDDDYFAQMKSAFGSSPIFSETETPASLAAVLTDFERDFLALGVKTQRAAYARRPGERA